MVGAVPIVHEVVAEYLAALALTTAVPVSHE